MAFLIPLGLWKQKKSWPREPNVAFLRSPTVVFLLNVPILGNWWKGSQLLGKTQTATLAPALDVRPLPYSHASLTRSHSLFTPYLEM